MSIILLMLFFSACTKENSSSVPEKAALINPLSNELCLNGIALSSSQSSITFKWNSAQFADSYELHITGLEKAPSVTYLTEKTQYDVSLLRNKAYSWYILCKSKRNNITTKSEVRRFYIPGPSSTSYAPFPAEAKAPLMGEAISVPNGKISLVWQGSDVDNDIVSYDVYFGLNSSPDILKTNIALSIISDVEVLPQKTYYWRVQTKDSNGNITDSELFQFKTK